MMERVELGKDWSELRGFSPRLEVLNTGRTVILYHVADSPTYVNRREPPEADVPTFELKPGECRVFGTEFIGADVWARAAAGAATATILRTRKAT